MESVVALRSALLSVACCALLGCGAGGGAPTGGDAGGGGTPEPEFVRVVLPAAAFTSVRSDGAPQPLFVVGDEGITLVADRVVLAFDLAGFPPARHVVAAHIWLETRGAFDDFGEGLGDVEALRVDLGAALDATDFDTDPLTPVLDGSPAPPYGFPLVLNVTPGLVQALDHGAARFDLRLQTTYLADGDDAADLLHLEHETDPDFGSHGPELIITFSR
jgi:hypothetical protein